MQRDTAAIGGQRPGGGVTKPETVAQCNEVIGLLVQQVAVLRAQNVLLLERLQLSSRNSSKPPSSDGPAAGNRAQRRASQRKLGAQKKHPGSYRAMLPEQQLSEVVECRPPALCECGAAVTAAPSQPRRHQVFEQLPAIQAQFTEHRLHRAALQRKFSGPSRSCGGEDFVARGYSAHEGCRR